MQKAITKQGSYRFPCPKGRAFYLSATGTFNGATLTVKFLNDVVAAGTAQVETATVTAASGITSDGICNLVISSTDYEVTIPVSLNTVTHTTAALIATAFKDAVNAHPFLSQKVTATTSTANLILTFNADPITGYKLANDAAFNIAIPAGLGISAAATSANTTAGVASLTVTEQPFSTTALSLTAAGEKNGVNVGSHDEIVVVITVADPTGIVVNVNPEALQNRIG